MTSDCSITVVKKNDSTQGSIIRPTFENPLSKAKQYSENVMMLEQNCKTTVIALAGINQAFGGIPPFNFLRAMGSIKANTIFVRDPNNKWFGDPISDLGANPSEMACRLAQISTELCTSDLCFLGISSGAFAALMLASLIKVPCRVLAFSPQTCIHPDFLASIGDSRYSKKLHGRSDEAPQDVIPLISNASNIHKIHVVQGTQEPLDCSHIERLAIIPNVMIHSLQCGHNTAGYLKRRNDLHRTLSSFITNNDRELESLLSSSWFP
jgi:hypothetical protein